LLSGTTTQLGGILISQLGYQWNDEEGHTVSKGSYDINVPNITLKPDQSDLIMVPVTCPMKNGLYELRVHFDNRILESAAATFNDKHAVFTNPSAQRYFSAEDIAKVTVKNSNW
jgi:hypothetical protein